MRKSKLKRFLALCLTSVFALTGGGASGVYAAAADNAAPGIVSEAGSSNAPDASAEVVQGKSEGLTWEKMDPGEVSADVKNTETAVGEEVQASLEDGQSEFADSDMVRVMIVMDEAAAISLVEGDEEEVTENEEVSAYRDELDDSQAEVAERISREALDGEKLDVVWNLTLVANAIAANVRFGKVSDIAQVDGVKNVYVERRYLPMEADTDNYTAQAMTSANYVKQQSGYTGAGMRVAVVDTGIDTDHQSFSEGGYQYSLKKNAEAKGISYDQYVENLGLLTLEKLEDVLPQLNSYKRDPSLTADDLYINSKLPYGYNYVDGSLDVTHDNDDEGEHGSHVAGIAAANSYVPGTLIYDIDGDDDFDQDDAQALMDFVICGTPVSRPEFADVDNDGVHTTYDVYLLLTYLLEDPHYVSAEDTVKVTGVAPDAQILTMKVFGQMGGAYPSDYMASVEDALVLGSHVANLSLGSGYPGFISAHGEMNLDQTESIDSYVNGVMEDVSKSGMVLAASAGNSGNWADNDGAFQLMYTDEGGTFNTSDPATYENSLSIASADNVGSTNFHTTVFSGADGSGAVKVALTDVADGQNQEWRLLDESGKGASFDVIFLGDPSNLFNGEEQTDESIYAGSEADFAQDDYKGKVVLVARGNGINFADKHSNAALAGAAAVVIYNNVDGTLNASIDGSEATVPCVGITLSDAKKIFDICSANEKGSYVGKVSVTRKVSVDYNEDADPLMSDFSSWGPTGALTLKPEITAPGGAILSVNGALSRTDGYEVMSGTSMSAPHVSGLVALADQYIMEKGMLSKARSVSGLSDLTRRALAQSLLMSTAVPLVETASGVEYSVRNQGAGLANIWNAVNAESFILMSDNTDGKVKAELGDGKDGYQFSFNVYNWSENSVSYDLGASMLTTGTTTREGEDGTVYYLTTDEMTALGADVTYSGSGVSGNTVTVAPGSSASVTVHITVPQSAAEKMESLGYTNGFYVEGYVYLNSSTGISHSIPLLGWYGNWTDPSMYDTGSTIDAFYGTGKPSHIPSTSKNMLAWSPVGADSGYPYTGNIYGGLAAELEDKTYIEDRNALNTVDGSWSIYAIFPTLIRTAADFKIQVTDADDGTVYFVDDYDEFDNSMIPCFYYDAYGDWYDVTGDYGIGLDWDYTDENGEPLEEGTNLNISLVCAPEYYLSEEGTRWDDLGDGAYLTYRFRVDNTAPDLADVESPIELVTKEDGTKTLRVQVQDNNYVAAVVLLNGAASEAVSYHYPDMQEDQRGKAVEIELDMTDYAERNGNKASFVIADYAGNETYYTVNLNGEGNPYGDFVGFQYDPDQGGNLWVSFDENVNSNESELFFTDEQVACAEYVNGYVFMQMANGELYAVPYADMLRSEIDLETFYVASLENVYQDLAYNYQDRKLYGLKSYTDDYGSMTEVWSVSLEAENAWTPAYMEEQTSLFRDGVVGLTFACDDEGSLYMLATETDEETQEDGTAHLWKSSLVEEWYGTTYNGFKDLGDTGLSMNYLQSMTWNHNDEQLYWARFDASVIQMESELYRIDTESKTDEEDPENQTVTCEKLGTLSTETGALFAPLGETAAAKDEHQNVPTMDPEEVGSPVLSSSNLTLTVNGTAALTCTFDPWYTKYREVTFTSSNPAIATVDANGLVTGVAPGTCTVTAASVQDPTLTADCNVTVASLSVEMSGVISRTDGGIGNVSNSSLYTYQMEEGVPTLTVGNPITAEGDFADFGLKLSCSTEARGSIWASEWGNTGMVYQINPSTGAVEDVLEPIDGDMMFGLGYSEELDTFSGIMNYFLYVDLPMTHQMYDEMADSWDDENYEYTWHKFDMSELLNASQGSFVTQEDSGITQIVFTGITNIGSDGKTIETYNDFLGGYNLMASYVPDTTWVLLDNVGRLWYIDEVAGMSADPEGGYMSENGGIYPQSYGGGPSGVFAQEYTAEDGSSSYNVFVIRPLVETPLTDMFRAGELGITYTFCDIYATKDANGTNQFFLSLYDYWNEGSTNELYLYIPGVPTGEWDQETWEEIWTPDSLYHLGDTGMGNIIATINSAKVTGGLPEDTQDGTDGAAAAVKSFIGYYEN